MGYIYLIGELDSLNTYKIGVTKHKNIEKRIAELQTGNAKELYVRTYFQSKYPYKLEKMLHRHYGHTHILNEWFTLTEDEAKNFIQTCEELEHVLEMLDDTTLAWQKKSDLFS